MNKPSPEEIESLYQKLKREGEAAGYYLNPDKEFTLDLVESLLVNEKRFGYQACPCRRAVGDIELDRDIICPCDYRDPDLNDFGMCFCGLYVDKKVLSGEKKAHSIPERRPAEKERKKMEQEKKESINSNKLTLPVWRCQVCGYLCAREHPPEICPICKVTQDRFEKFM